MEAQSTTLTFFALAGAWTATTAGTWSLFEKSETAASPYARQLVKSWLESSSLDGSANKWAGTFMSAFDSIFGVKLLSWSAFQRSCVASLVCLVISFLIWVFVRPGQALNFYHSNWFLSDLGVFGLIVCIVNFGPDYLSLMQTRWFIGRMQRSSGPLSAFILLVANTLVSALIGLIATAVFLMWTEGSWQKAISVILRQAIPLTAENDGMTVGLMSYASLFTSFWLWLYCLSAATLKLGRSLKIARSALTRFVNVEEKPFLAIGVIAVLIETVAFLVIAIWFAVARLL
jgi:hypothetical protein